MCLGNGTIRVTKSFGGHFKEVLEDCDRCDGSGEIIPELNKCEVCSGKKVLK